MAEFAASIIGIVSAGTKVALVLSQLAADVGSAGHEARMIGGEIRSFCSVLRTLGETIEIIEKSPRYAHCSELISDMTDDSLQMFTEILNAVDKLRKMTSGREGRDGNFGLVERLQWAVFKKPKLLVLRAAIEAYKTNLTLMLSTLSTVERTARPMLPFNNADIHVTNRQQMSLIKALEMYRDKTLTELARVERHYTGNVSPAPTEHSTAILDVSSDCNPPFCEGLEPYSGSRNYGLIIAARNEISSIRSSLSKKSRTDDEALRDKIARHSKRISRMLEDGQRVLSEHWSQTPQDDLVIYPEATSSKLSSLTSSQELVRGWEHNARSRPRSNMKAGSAASSAMPRDRKKAFLHSDGVAIYKAFVAYICKLDECSQQQVLRALDQDIAEANCACQQSSLSPNRSSKKATDPGRLRTSPAMRSQRRPSSPKPTASAARTDVSRRTHAARVAVPRDCKAAALPALQYVQQTRTGTDFLSDRSRRPPGQKSPAARSEVHSNTRKLALETPRRQPLSSTSIVPSTYGFPTPRQEALARLTGLDLTPEPRPTLPPSLSLPALENTSIVPKSPVSKHRRSRSEHTLVVTRSDVTLEVFSAPSKDPLCGPGMKEPVEDTSDDESDNEESLLWWRSIGTISPQPLRLSEHTPSA